MSGLDYCFVKKEISNTLEAQEGSVKEFTCMNNDSIMHSSQTYERTPNCAFSSSIGQFLLSKLKKIRFQKLIDEQVRTR
jgi:hypothetical protein